MQSLEHQDRFCIYNDTDGYFRISMGADDFVVLGADFKIVNPSTKEIIEEWKLSTDNGKVVNYDIIVHPKELHKMKLVWKVLCCSANPNKFEGKVAVKVLQNNVPLKLTIPSNYILKNVPPCQLQSTEDFSGSLIFIKK